VSAADVAAGPQRRSSTTDPPPLASALNGSCRGVPACQVPAQLSRVRVLQPLRDTSIGSRAVIVFSFNASCARVGVWVQCTTWAPWRMGPSLTRPATAMSPLNSIWAQVGTCTACSCMAPQQYARAMQPLDAPAASGQGGAPCICAAGPGRCFGAGCAEGATPWLLLAPQPQKAHAGIPRLGPAYPPHCPGPAPSPSTHTHTPCCGHPQAA
jgi:hypothetical protein